MSTRSLWGESLVPDVGGDTEPVYEKRLTVLKLHVDELTRQAAGREAELRAAHAKLREAAKERALQAPNERKLFAKLEHKI